MIRRDLALVGVLTVISLALSGRAIWATEPAAGKASACEAATPVPNPWTKGLPGGWWEKRHADILAAPARQEARVAFIGDSITDGWDKEGAGLKVWEKEWAPMKAFNLGIVCDSTQHALWRILNGEVDGMPNLKLCVIEIGVNNKGINNHSEEDVEKGIIALCEALKAKAPQARILVVGVFPRYFGRDNSVKLNRRLARLVDGRRVFFININEQLKETEGAIADAVGHLTEKGYQIWADSIRPTVKKLMDPEFRTEPVAARLDGPAEDDPDDASLPAGIKKCRATASVMNARSPRWYSKNFNILVWGRKFELQKAECVFLGSSHSTAWPQEIWEKEYAPVHAMNLSFTGDCTENVLWRVENGVAENLPKLKLMIIEVGSENKRQHQDSAEDIAAGIEAICARIRAKLPEAVIVLMGVFPPSSADDKNKEVNALISKLADGKQVLFVDINDILLKTPGALKDGNTLTEKGYEVWADELRPLIRKFMAPGGSAGGQGH